MSSSTINPSERFVIGFFLILLCSFTLIAKISSWKAKNLLSEVFPLETVHIEVSGEVLRPGVYEFPLGVSCQKVLEKAKPKKFADLSPIDQMAPAPIFLFVPPLEQIHVLIQGPGALACELSLPPGTRLSDLKSKIYLQEFADLSLFRSRKMLKDGEIIFVEKRK